MAKRRTGYVALLRGINVSGKNKIPMTDLRSLCTGIKCEEVNTYIQSGNVVFNAVDSAQSLEKRLETAIAERFSLTIPVIVRTASVWHKYVKGNPFPNEAETEANWILLCLSKRPPHAAAASKLQQHVTQGERVIKKGDAIWIHYANGIARSKLTPVLLDRYAGSPVTARNWRTVLKLGSMAQEVCTVAGL